MSKLDKTGTSWLRLAVAYSMTMLFWNARFKYPIHIIFMNKKTNLRPIFPYASQDQCSLNTCKRQWFIQHASCTRSCNTDTFAHKGIWAFLPLPSVWSFHNSSSNVCDRRPASVTGKQFIYFITLIICFVCSNVFRKLKSGNNWQKYNVKDKDNPALINAFRPKIVHHRHSW